MYEQAGLAGDLRIMMKLEKLMGRRFGQWAGAVLLSGLLAACGGGGSAGDPVLGGGTGGSGATGAAPKAEDLVLTLSSASLPNDDSRKALLTVTALNANRNAIKDVPVTISVNANAIATPSGTVTNEAGIVTAAIGIGSDSSNRKITATATSGSLSKTVTLDVVDPSTSGTGATVSVDLSTSLITPQVPAVATVTVRSASGAVVSGVVVGVSAVRGGLASLSTDSSLTDSAGVAKVTLTANSTGLKGADSLTATATVAGVQISASKGFSVAGASPTLSISANSTTLSGSAGPVPVSVTLLDEKGSPAGGKLVNFTSSARNVIFTSATSLTDGAGVARTSAYPKDSSVSGADVIQATATYGSTSLDAALGVQIVGEVPSADITLSNSAVTATSPATAQVLVKNAQGVVVKDAVVSFASAYGLVAFDAQTAKTNSSGIASVVVSPKTSSSNGGDELVASVTVGGVVASSRKGLQVSAGTTSGGSPTLQLGLTSTSISAASPATVSVTLLDARGVAAAGQVVTFSVVRNLAKTNVATALTNGSGVAVVQLSPVATSSAGADEVVAAAQYAGVSLQASKGFQIQATNVSINDVVAVSNPLSAYGQTPITVTLTGASIESPVKVSVSSACVALGKASLSPATFSTTNSSFTLQYRDNGCGAVQLADQLQVVIDGTATSKTLKLDIAAPAASSLAFVQASPETIFLKASGFTENSIVTFEVRDAAGNTLPGRVVELRLLTGSGGVTMEGRPVEAIDSTSPFTQTSDAQGRVAVRINSGTQPTPVRVHAQLQGTKIATVSSNLSVAVGLPSQLNFSMSQGSINIEGGDIDGTTNTYTIIASDRSGNPVPAGTTINFVTEGGQVEPSKQIQIVGGIGRATANFVTSSPRPADGRVTVLAYALGEESFLDLNGNNIYDKNEPFQDLGSVFKDRNFDGVFDVDVDEFVPLNVNNSSACVPPTSPLLALDASIPSRPGSCDGVWSGAGQVYVRRAVETIFSTSAARPLWPLSLPSGLTGTSSPIVLRTSGNAAPTSSFTPLGGDICRTPASTITIPFSFLVADANAIRLNPMAAGTRVSVSTSSPGTSVELLGGAVVPSVSEVSTAIAAVTFTTGSEALVTVRIVSPGGTTTSSTLTVRRSASCP